MQKYALLRAAVGGQSGEGRGGEGREMNGGDLSRFVGFALTYHKLCFMAAAHANQFGRLCE